MDEMDRRDVRPLPGSGATPDPARFDIERLNMENAGELSKLELVVWPPADGVLPGAAHLEPQTRDLIIAALDEVKGFREGSRYMATANGDYAEVYFAGQSNEVMGSLLSVLEGQRDLGAVTAELRTLVDDGAYLGKNVETLLGK